MLSTTFFRLLLLLPVVMGVGGCAFGRAQTYPGPRLPDHQVARFRPAQMIQRLDGTEFHTMHDTADLLPGKHEIEMKVEWVNRHVDRFLVQLDAKPGRVYTIGFHQVTTEVPWDRAVIDGMGLVGLGPLALPTIGVILLTPPPPNQPKDSSGYVILLEDNRDGQIVWSSPGGLIYAAKFTSCTLSRLHISL